MFFVKEKRIEQRAASSDNKLAGRDEEIQPHEVPEIHIAGRVMWYGRTI